LLTTTWQRSARCFWPVLWLATTVTMLGLLANSETKRVDPDEVYWIGSAYYYHLAFERGEWTHPDWQLLPARENPPGAKYVLGLGLALTGRHVTTLDGLGSFYAYFAANLGRPESERAHGAKQDSVMSRMNPALLERVTQTRQMYINPELLVAARRVMVVCAAILSLLVFILGSSISSRATGLLASLLVLAHPAVTHAYTLAMADAVGLMFGAAAALTAWFFFQRHSEPLTGHPERSERVRASAGAAVRPALGLAAVNGVLLGFAVASKMNWLTVAFLFGAVVLAAAFMAWRRGDHHGAKLAIVSGALTAFVALAVFVLINPTILFNPIDGLVDSIRQPALTTAVQVRVLPPNLHLATLGAKLDAVATMLLGSPVLFVLVIAAAVVAAVRTARPGIRFVAAWCLIAFVCVVAWIPFEWRRYILPIVLPFALLVAHMVVSAVSAIVTRRPATAASE
jgi:hypothetical protein